MSERPYGGHGAFQNMPLNPESQKPGVYESFSPYNPPTEAGASSLSVEAPQRLLRVAMTARRMVEDGHPNDPSWFRIMSERLTTVMDLTDAALMEGEEAALGLSVEAPQLDVPSFLRSLANERGYIKTSLDHALDEYARLSDRPGTEGE